MRSGGVAVAVLVLVVAGVAFGVGMSSSPSSRTPAPMNGDDLVRPVENGSAIWPHTSRSQSVAGRTLAMNVIVTADARTVRRVLVDRTPREWHPATNDTHAVVDLEGVHWRQARGAVRYTYVQSPNGEGRWIHADYQLAAGDYLGTRLHVRAFRAPGDGWTALQAHQEYWDWFRLRHTVTGVSSAGEFVTTDLDERPSVTVGRLDHGQRGGGSDGSLWLVELALATLLFGGLVGNGGLGGGQLGPALRRAARGLPLAAVIGALYLGVRVTGIALELAIPTVNPRLFAVALYPALVAGIPALVWRLAPRFQPIVAFGLAIVGLGAGIGLDFWSLGVTVLPARLLLHRGLLLAAIGVLAAGCAQAGRTGRRIRWLGAAAWVGALLLPLADLV